QEERNEKQENWINNKTRVIVCTNAFGMGIDKPDVRVVIHADVPDCLENYYQEAGRAGRDGKRAYAVLLYSEKDLQELERLAEIRYPTLEEIRNVYQSIANYLQISSNTGEGMYFDFDLTDFIKKFKLNSHTALYSLKALEQTGSLSFNEQVFLPSTVLFTTDKTQLHEFEKLNPSLDPLIKALLRAYEGIFDYPASISELVLVRLMKKNVEEIKKELLQLHQPGIIEYSPQKDKPQIYLLSNRVKAEDLFINMADHLKRKELFKKRVTTIIQFVKRTIQCRSRIIGFYFGDDNIKACGICDNCLRQKSITISKEEFETINYRIVDTIQAGTVNTKELLQKLNGIKKEKAWKVLEFLQAENRIVVDQNGMIKVK
ncbi:MAG: RecQ family zinc-binding domain-containing protein, partial [Bacteroidota bacterium]|nr:RecQ family zinc-binding domain-containing protein [Bacteroidota bacterium]